MIGIFKSYKNTDPDYDLVIACKKGDQQAFDALYKKYHRSALNYVLRQVLSYEDAEDIFQDIFLNIFNKISSFRYQSKFQTFLYRSLQNRIINLWKKRKREQKTFTNENDNRKNGIDAKSIFESKRLEGDRSAQAKELYTDFVECMHKLNSQQYEIFNMNILDTLTYQDVSEILEIKKGTVKSNVNRARNSIKECLEKIHGDIRHALQ